MNNGSRSRFQLTKLAAKFNEIQGDGRIQSNRPLITIVQARIQQLIERLDTAETPDRVAKLHELWTEYRLAPNEVDATKFRNMLDKEFDRVYHDYASWRQIFEALSLHKDLTAAEMKVYKELQAILTAEDAYNLAAQLLAAVFKHVDDPITLTRIQYEFNRITGVGNVKETRGAEPEIIEVGPGSMDSEQLLDP